MIDWFVKWLVGLSVGGSAKGGRVGGMCLPGLAEHGLLREGRRDWWCAIDKHQRCSETNSGVAEYVLLQSKMVGISRGGRETKNIIRFGTIVASPACTYTVLLQHSPVVRVQQIAAVEEPGQG